MKAMVLNQICNLTENRTPLVLTELADPVPKDGEILVSVSACGVCHTELDEIEGRTPPPLFPVVLGHEIVGRVVQNGPGTEKFQLGDRVGIAWIHSACGACSHCLAGNENLCAQFRATGRDANGGYAELTTVPERFAYRIPEGFSDLEAAPLLCAGAIGYRSLRLTGLKDGQNLGLTGFGGSAHLVLMMARHKFPNSRVFVFARHEKERLFAIELGAVWAGSPEDDSPEKLDSIIDTTPAWKPVVEALKNLKSGGRLVINAIRKESADQPYLMNLDYPIHLWLEKEIKSVANVTAKDVEEFLQLAAAIPIRPEIQVYPLEEANTALVELKEKHVRGAKVLEIAPGGRT
ncbi:MAG: zinc-dependent alcohol dehydrogenase family protein [Desulfobacterales bacterium]|nr:zinc-dependent alcohol dehydrogenase family protein [Desulfobacterales bacterium]MDD4073483.1 zinc-dependent alcohol dehydrogenase family protein [Desulfobacterales bacterium]MDD4394053.1 zinc-dependent alcohol dehydrogenase family protein [Desulfobacterales bacterium]